MTAETCGISDMPANVAPPLKSTSTMLSCSGEWVIDSPSTSVRRNSDLPDPVAPMTRPCGPMPCWADSLMSRCTMRAALAEADRHPEPVACGAWAPGGARLEPAYVAEAEQVHEVRRAGDLAAGRLLRRAGRRGVQRREPSRERLGRRLVALVALGPDRLLPHPQREQRHPALLVGRSAVLELQPQPAGVLELAPAAWGGRPG